MPKYAIYAGFRERMGLNDYTLAKKAELSPSTISDWKHGKSKPSVKNLQKIAAVLDCTIDELIEG